MMEQFLPTTFTSVDKILWCYHSNQTSSAVLSHGTTFSEEFTKKNWNASEFFYHAHYYICKSEKIKNTAIFLNWYEALSLLKIILVTYKSLKETFFKKKKDKKNELVLTFVLFLIILK